MTLQDRFGWTGLVDRFHETDQRRGIPCSVEEFPVPSKKFPVPREKFPVILRTGNWAATH
jgi:hypothetical protein